MRLLVCGSREWSDVERVEMEMIDMLGAGAGVVIHGAARGVDQIAHTCALGRWDVAAFPADWEHDGKAAGPKRNARMLADGKPDRGLAVGRLWRWDRVDPGSAHYGWRRTGTGDMVQRMLRAGLPVRWVASPDTRAVDLVAMPEPPR